MQAIQLVYLTNSAQWEVTGTFPVGATGVSLPVPIVDGGTGQTTASAALTALGGIAAAGGTGTGTTLNQALIVGQTTFSNGPMVHNPFNQYITNAPLTAVLGQNFVTAAPGTFTGWHAGDNIVFSNFDQYAVLQVISSSKIAVVPVVQGNHTSSIGTHYYPVMDYWTDINGNPGASMDSGGCLNLYDSTASGAPPALVMAQAGTSNSFGLHVASAGSATLGPYYWSFDSYNNQFGEGIISMAGGATFNALEINNDNSVSIATLTNDNGSSILVSSTLNTQAANTASLTVTNITSLETNVNIGPIGAVQIGLFTASGGFGPQLHIAGNVENWMMISAQPADGSSGSFKILDQTQGFANRMQIDTAGNVTFNVGGGGVTTAGLNATSLVIGASTNTASFTLVQTNWIDGGTYTNNTGRTIFVMTPCSVTPGTGVAGQATYALKVPTWTTNVFSIGTLSTSLAMPQTNNVQSYVPAGDTFTFTNLSSGTGSSAAIVKGGQYMVY